MSIPLPEQAFAIPLPGNQRAVLITAPLTDEAWDVLERVLALYRPALTYHVEVGVAEDTETTS